MTTLVELTEVSRTYDGPAGRPPLTRSAWTSRAHAKQDADLTWRPPIDLVLIAFNQHPLVALCEGAGHGQLETRDFFAALIRDRRFALTVRNIVIEFGNGRYQAVMDRYVTGGPVTRDEHCHCRELHRCKRRREFRLPPSSSA